MLITSSDYFITRYADQNVICVEQFPDENKIHPYKGMKLLCDLTVTWTRKVKQIERNNYLMLYNVSSESVLCRWVSFYCDSCIGCCYINLQLWQTLSPATPSLSCCCFWHFRPSIVFTGIILGVELDGASSGYICTKVIVSKKVDRIHISKENLFQKDTFH